MTLVRTAAALMAATFALGALAAGNTTNEDFRDSKKMLERKVYFDHRVTGRVEWEHVVPAENFGRAFKEWREGDGRCTNEKGHFYKGRRCAEKMSAEYRLMQADMYNLFPAVGAVNAIRSNYNYELLPGVPNTFGTCEMKIDGRRAEPPERSRGEIARAMLYMEGAYAPVFRMSDRQRRLAQNWNEQHPVVQWECTRAARIEKLQGNVNPVVKDACLKAGLTYRP